MEKARANKRKIKVNSSSPRKRTSKLNQPEKCDGRKQKSLVEMFANQRKNARSVFPQNAPAGLSGLLEIIDVDMLDDPPSKSMQVNGVEDKNQNETSKIDRVTSDKTVEESLKEFLEDDDSLFSSIDTENLSQATSQGDPNIISTSHRVPYYVDNFKQVIQSVYCDSFFSYLFDNNDKLTVDTYLNKLTLPQQKLYTRIFLRKYRWLRLDQISYNDIEVNIVTLADALVDKGMFVGVSSLTDLSEALKCLNAGEVKSLAKSLQLNPNLTRAELISTIESHSNKSSIASFFSKTSPALKNVVLNKVKSQLGPCYRLESQRRSTFIRIMMLSSLCNTVSDDDFSGQQQIFQMLSASIGLSKFPDYVIRRESKIFRDRSSLIRYGEVLECESRLWKKVEYKKYEEALVIYEKAKDEFADCLLLDLDHVELLPQHLRAFTCGAAYVRIMSRGVSVLQFLKRFDEAVEQLKRLTEQRHYHLDYRGRWYDRLTLNLDFHLKRHSEALKYVVEALSDPNVRTGHRLDLLCRGKKILSSKGKKMTDVVDSVKSKIEEDVMSAVREAPSVTIKGHRLPKPVQKTGSIWLFGREDATVMSGVEQLALEHYSKSGYPEGIHGEGLTFTCLFNLLFWDVVFDDSIPDTFYNLFQTSPLDLRTDGFYSKREQLFRERFELLEKATSAELDEMVESCWRENFGTSCSGLDWELFRDVDHAKGLVRSCGGKLLSGIMERMSRQMRFVTGGVPDLVVWNPKTEKMKFVEVKGPGDKLSSKQVLWLDHLVLIRADAEVCHVKAENSKRLKM